MLRFFMGLIIGALAASAGGAIGGAFDPVYAKVNTNGMLKGYIVQDKRGRVVCKDPMVQLHFRGPESYINCR